MSEYHLTIILLTFNEEANVPALIKNLEGIPAHVYVVDSFSTDQTVSLLQQHGWRYDQHEFGNYSLQRNWAQQNNPFNTKWVFHLDADERLTPELKKWLLTSFNSDINEVDGFIFGRRALFMNQWIKSHYNFHLRLYKSAAGKCEQKAYDQHFIVSGTTKVIKNCDIESYVCDNLNEFIAKHNKWAMMEAFDILRKGAHGEVRSDVSGSPIERKRWFKNVFFNSMPLFLRSFIYFFYRYFFQLGFLDGTKGFVFHVLQAFWFRFLIDAKVYEIKSIQQRKKITLEEAILLYKL